MRGTAGTIPALMDRMVPRRKKSLLPLPEKLAELINHNPVYEAVLVRKGDYYVILEKECKLPGQPRPIVYFNSC